MAFLISGLEMDGECGRNVFAGGVNASLPAEPPAWLAVSDTHALTVIQVVVGAELDAWKGPGLFLRWGHVGVEQGIPSIPSVLPQMQLVLILCGAKAKWFERLDGCVQSNSE